MNSYQKLREQITQIEQKIRAITGNKASDFASEFAPVNREFWAYSPQKHKEVEQLLRKRKETLSAMFVATSEEVERMEQVNARLLDLTQKMYARINALYHHMVTTTYDHEFDDDVEVEGKLSFIVNGENSIQPMANDDYYGSDFYYIIDTIDSLLYHSRNFYAQAIAFASKHLAFMHSNPKDGIMDEELEDELNCRVWPFPHIQTADKFPHLRTCHELYSLCRSDFYSIPDILRMNDFWVEVTVKYQHIVELDGTRYNRFNSKIHTCR